MLRSVWFFWLTVIISSLDSSPFPFRSGKFDSDCETTKVKTSSILFLLPPPEFPVSMKIIQRVITLSLSLSFFWFGRVNLTKENKKWKLLNCQSLEIRFAAEGMNPIFRSALSLFFSPFFPPAFDDVELFSLAFVNLSAGGEYVFSLFWEFGRDFPPALPPSKSENLQSPKIPSWMRDKHVPFSFSLQWL